MSICSITRSNKRYIKMTHKFVTLLVKLPIVYDWIHESDEGVKYYIYNIFENTYDVTRDDGKRIRTKTLRDNTVYFVDDVDRIVILNSE